MKFSTYSPAVNPSVMRNVPVHASRDMNVYGVQGGGEQWKAIGKLANIGLEMQKKVTDGKILEANAEYNRLMSEGTSALMQKKEGEALNIADEYDKLQKQVLNDVRKNYKQFIGFGAGAEAFNAYTMKDDATRRSGVVRYQQAQTDAYHETQYNNQLAECRNEAVEGGGTVEAVNGALNRLDAIVNTRFGEYGGEKLIEQKRIAAGQIVGDAVNMAINSGDFAKAESLLSAYKGVLPTNAYIDARTKLHKQQEKVREYTAIDDIAARCRDVNGKIDLARGFAAIDAICGQDAKGTGGASGSDVAAAASAYINQETPYGRNGCVWAATNIGKNFSPLLRKANDAGIVNVGELLRFAKNEGASIEPYREGSARPGDAVVYFAPGDELTEENAEHVVLADGGGGYWGNSSGAADFQDENGETVKGNGYIIHGDSTDLGDNLVPRLVIRTAGGEDVSAYDPEKRDKLRRLLKAQYDSEQALERQERERNLAAAKDALASAGSYAEAVAILEDSGLDAETKEKLDKKAQGRFGVGNAKADGSGDVAADEYGEAPIIRGEKYTAAKRNQDTQKLYGAGFDIEKGAYPSSGAKWMELETATERLLTSGKMFDVDVAGYRMATEPQKDGSPNPIAAGAMEALAEGKSMQDVYLLLTKGAGLTKGAAMAVLVQMPDEYKATGKAEEKDDDVNPEDFGGVGGEF